MLQTYEALLNKNGQVTWLDTPPVVNNVKVLITVVSDTEDTTQDLGQRRIGSLAGKAKFPDDINKYDDEVAKLFGVEL